MSTITFLVIVTVIGIYRSGQLSSIKTSTKTRVLYCWYEHNDQMPNGLEKLCGNPDNMPAEYTTQQIIPQCQEDEVYLKGHGDFSHGRWSEYTCQHEDTL